MNTWWRVFVSTVAASVVACSNIEVVDRVDAETSFSATACTFVGPKQAFERPTWQFFEPSPRDGIVHGSAGTERVARIFADLGYDLDQVRRGTQAVPRFMLASLPHDLAQLDSIEQRKAMFLATVLPVALYVNEKVLEQRRVLEAMHDCVRRDVKLGSRAKAWLRSIADLYDGDPDIGYLLTRVDAVPPSLLLAQAAIESAWGTSRFAQEGNALFGEYTYKYHRGLLPRAFTPDARFRVRHFEHVVESVVSYVRNLNTHPAYESFRIRRATFRAIGAAPDGLTLANELVRYSTRRQVYVRELRTVIRINRLQAFDDATLERTPTLRMASNV